VPVPSWVDPRRPWLLQQQHQARGTSQHGALRHAGTLRSAWRALGYGSLVAAGERGAERWLTNWGRTAAALGTLSGEPRFPVAPAGDTRNAHGAGVCHSLLF
jgi:hypothetical protein